MLFRSGFVIHDFEGPEPDLRTLLERIVFTQEVWTAAIGGTEFPTHTDRGIAALQSRWVTVHERFAALVRRIRDRHEWDDAFVDALCTPPASFTFGSVVAHILNASAVRRQMAVSVLRELGVADVETRDAIEWERLMSASA